VPDYTGTETVLCPGGTQGRNWHNDAYSPRTGLLYTSVNLTCQMMVVIEGEYVVGEGYTLNRRFNTAIPRTDDAGNLTPATGQLQANDPVAGAHAWTVDFTVANQLPIMATATDLLFMGGNDEGVMRALDATNGETVWEFRTGSRFNQSPITYLHDGKQYVAIIASSAPTNVQVAADARQDDANRYRRSGSTLYVFGLPGAVAAN
jgi:outer membrane protein assembly factor BamB